MNKLTKFAVMAAFLGLFASCSTDEPILDEEQDKIVQEDQTLYVKVVVHGENNNGTRAAGDDGSPGANDFVNGSTEESEISTLYFVFYDDSGNIVGNIVNAQPLPGKSGISGDAVENIYENTVAVSLMKGQARPTQVMCYVNPISLDDIQKPLDIIQTVTRTTVKSDEYGFPMGNSVYYDGEKKLSIAAKIDGKIYSSEKEADEATEGVDIYVERRAARLTFQLENSIYEGTKVKQPYQSAGTDAADSEYPTYSLTFHIDGWDVNAQAKTTYIVKSFRKREMGSAAIHPDNFEYDDKNALINRDIDITGGAWKWNSSTYHRSYWSISPAYFVDKYPEVASDVNETEELMYIHPEKKSGEKYPWKTVLDGSATEYYREATVGKPALVESKNPAAAVASVILKGYYTIGEKTDPVDFYSFQKDKTGKYFIFPKNKGDVEGNGMTMLERFIQLQSVLYKKTAENKYTQITIEEAQALEDAKVLAICRPDDTVLQNREVEDSEDLKVASRQQTLQILEVPEGNTTLCYASPDGYTVIGEDNVKEVNLALIHQLGFASFYNMGQAYFNIPIKHLGWYRGANNNKDKDKIDWSEVRIGDFGMVRNHSYTIEVQSISGLGTGIGTPTDPIIPPAENKDYYVKYKVNVLKWALVPKQEVAL